MLYILPVSFFFLLLKLGIKREVELKEKSVLFYIFRFVDVWLLLNFIRQIELFFWESVFWVDTFCKWASVIVIKYLIKDVFEIENKLDAFDNIVFAYAKTGLRPWWLAWRSRMSILCIPVDWFKFIEFYNNNTLKLLMCNESLFTLLRNEMFAKGRLKDVPVFYLIKKV